jgi:hypothetical protein
VRARLLAALARGYQVAVYTFVGSAGVANLAPVHSMADLRAAGTTWVFAAITGIASGVIAFLVSTASNGAGGLGVDHVIAAGKGDGS